MFTCGLLGMNSIFGLSLGLSSKHHVSADCLFNLNIAGNTVAISASLCPSKSLPCSVSVAIANYSRPESLERIEVYLTPISGSWGVLVYSVSVCQGFPNEVERAP